MRWLWLVWLTLLVAGYLWRLKVTTVLLSNTVLHHCPNCWCYLYWPFTVVYFTIWYLLSLLYFTIWYYLCWAKVRPQFDQLSPPPTLPPQTSNLPLCWWEKKQSETLLLIIFDLHIDQLSLHVIQNIYQMMCLFHLLWFPITMFSLPSSHILTAA